MTTTSKTTGGASSLPPSDSSSKNINTTAPQKEDVGAFEKSLKNEEKPKQPQSDKNPEASENIEQFTQNLKQKITESKIFKDPNTTFPVTIPLKDSKFEGATLIVKKSTQGGIQNFQAEIKTASPKDNDLLSQTVVLSDIQSTLKKELPSTASLSLEANLDLSQLNTAGKKEVQSSLSGSLNDLINRTGISSEKPSITLPATLPLNNNLLPNIKVNITKTSDGKISLNMAGQSQTATNLLAESETITLIKNNLPDAIKGNIKDIKIQKNDLSQTFTEVAEKIQKTPITPRVENLSNQELKELLPQINSSISSKLEKTLSQKINQPYNITTSLEELPVEGLKLNIEHTTDPKGEPKVKLTVLSDTTEGATLLKDLLGNVSTQVKDISIQIGSAPSPKAVTIDSIAKKITSALKDANILASSSTQGALMKSINFDSQLLPNTELKYSIGRSETGDKMVNLQFNTASIEASSLLDTPETLTNLQNILQEKLSLPESTVFNFNVNTSPEVKDLAQIASLTAQTVLNESISLNTTDNLKPVSIPISQELQQKYPDLQIKIIPSNAEDGSRIFKLNIENAPLALNEQINNPEMQQAFKSILQRELMLPTTDNFKFSATLSQQAQGLQGELDKLVKEIKNNNVLQSKSEEKLKVPLSNEKFPNTEASITVKEGKVSIALETTAVEQFDNLKNNQPAIISHVATQLGIPPQDVKVTVPTAPSMNAVMTEMTDQIKVGLPNTKGGQEVTIQLKNDVLPGTQIKISMVDGILKIALETTSAHSQSFLAQNQSSLSAHLQKNLDIENVQITVQNTSDSEQSDPEGGSRQKYVAEEDEEQK